MKKLIILLVAVPFFGLAQSKKKTEVAASKGFVISGNVTGQDGAARAVFS